MNYAAIVAIGVVLIVLIATALYLTLKEEARKEAEFWRRVYEWSKR